MRFALVLLALSALMGPGGAIRSTAQTTRGAAHDKASPAALVRTAVPVTVADRSFFTSDHVRLHYLEAGTANAHTIVFVPGWTMPAWIWQPQIQAFSRHYHVVAFDPRGQGESEAPAAGYDHVRRAADLATLITQLSPVPIVIVGWSLGVLDTLAYVHIYGDALLAGLILVDNSVGEEPPPTLHTVRPHPGPPPPRAAVMRRFVDAMFRHPQPETYLERLTQATLHTPEAASRALLAYPVPRSYWREAVYSTSKPLLYAVRPRFAGQADNLARKRPDTETAVFADAGHALFVDDAVRFNRLMDDFLRHRVWP